MKIVFVRQDKCSPAFEATDEDRDNFFEALECFGDDDDDHDVDDDHPRAILFNSDICGDGDDITIEFLYDDNGDTLDFNKVIEHISKVLNATIPKYEDWVDYDEERQSSFVW